MTKSIFHGQIMILINGIILYSVTKMLHYETKTQFQMLSDAAFQTYKTALHVPIRIFSSTFSQRAHVYFNKEIRHGDAIKNPFCLDRF